MPDLRRCYGSGYLHFITLSCYRRLRLLVSTRRRDLLDQNPVKRRLVMEAEQWRWSSYRHYALGERGWCWWMSRARRNESSEFVGRGLVSRLDTEEREELEILSYRRQECPAFENREDRGSLN